MAHQGDVDAVLAAFGMAPFPYRTFPPAPAIPPSGGDAVEGRPMPPRHGRRGWTRQDVARPGVRPGPVQPLP